MMRRHNNLDYFHIYKGFIRHQNLLIIKSILRKSWNYSRKWSTPFQFFNPFPLSRAKVIRSGLKIVNYFLGNIFYSFPTPRISDAVHLH